MEIFINGEKKNYGIKGGKLFSVLERVQNNLFQEGEIIIELQIDGKLINGNDLPINKKVKVLEFKTRTHRELTIESLYLLKKHRYKFYENLDRFEIGEGDYTTALEIISFIEWVQEIILRIKDLTMIDMIYYDYDNYVQDFKKYSKEVYELFKEEKFDSMLDTIDMAIIPLIDNLVANSENYLKQLLKEEIGKKMLN